MPKGKQSKRRPQSPKSPRKTAQADNIRAQLAALDAERRRLEADLKAAERDRQEITRQDRDAARRARQLEREVSSARRAGVVEIRQVEALLDLGLYHPKKLKRRKGKIVSLTPGQKRYARKKWRQFRELMDPHETVIVRQTSRSPGKRQAIAKQFRKSGVVATDRAIFVPKQGEVTRAELTVDRKGRPTVKIRRKFTQSKTGRHGETVYITAVGADEILAEKARLKKWFRRLAGKLTPDHHVRAYVEGKFGTHRVFAANEFDELWELFNTYWTKNAHLMHGITRVSLGIVGPGDPKDRGGEDDDDEEEAGQEAWSKPDARGRSRKLKRRPGKKGKSK